MHCAYTATRHSFDHFEGLFQQYRFAPERLVEPEDHHVLLGLIAAGSGVALVPASLTSHARRGVIYRRLVEESALRMEIAVTFENGDYFPALEILLDIQAGRSIARGSAAGRSRSTSIRDPTISSATRAARF